MRSKACHTGACVLGALLFLSTSCKAQTSEWTSYSETWDWSNAGSKLDAVTKARQNSLLALFAPTEPTTGVQSSTIQAQQIQLFNDWSVAQNLTFTPGEQAAAFENFKTNMGKVYEVNTNQNVKFWLSANQFSGMSFSEFKAMYLMSTPNVGPPTAGTVETVNVSSTQAPLVGATTVDWVAAGYSTAVKNQGGCGSCWAYAAAAVIESMYLIKVGGTSQTASLALSTQQMTSCCNAAYGYGSQGCNGGWSDEVSELTYSRLHYYLKRAVIACIYQ